MYRDNTFSDLIQILGWGLIKEPKVMYSISWRRKWQPIPIFLTGEFLGQRILAGYSPWGRKDSDMTEQLSLTHTLIIVTDGTYLP